MIQLEDKLYTSTEVAEVLGVSLRSVYRYLEENKLNAEVKTATGRHRFSKQNILDFLYPNGADALKALEQDAALPVKPVSTKSTRVQTEPVAEEPVQTKKQEEVVEEEPIDWLAKFRDAAKKFKEESETAQAAAPAEEAPAAPARPVETEVIPEPVFEAETVSGFAETEEPAPADTLKHYYRSGLGGLKDIAQNIDKNSRNSFLDYAFTLNAGLSLFKPIKPFSMLHAYVRPSDVSYFEKTLMLTPTEEGNAQLCLLVSDDNGIYTGREELHGLFVVSKERLAKDVKNLGDSGLSAEAQSVLS